MKFHKLLEKQIEKFFPDKDGIPQQFQPLLEAISQSYEDFEKDKQLSEDAFAVSEKEYREVLSSLEDGENIRIRSIEKLKDAIAALDPDASLLLPTHDDELMAVVSYLENLVKKTKLLEAEMVNTRNEALKAAAAKGEFLSVMSHEIRTPLNAIIGIIHLMLHEKPLPSQVENLKTLHISAENLLHLINDILDFSKIEEGKIAFSEKPMDLKQVVSNIRMAYRIRAEENGNSILVAMDPGIPPVLMGDEVRLGQVLNNLVSNAVKFTRNGQISIGVKMMDCSDELADLLFTVSDTGIGIEKDKQNLIFDRFTQAHSDITRQFGGSGLGLAIIKKLLELQNSRIQLESEPGQGSRFHFRLNFRIGKGLILPSSDKKETDDNLKGVRVLLVEDVEFNVMVAEKMLHNWHAEVEVAVNGLVAVGKAKEGNFDIILMDLQMPVLDGYSATRHIREFNPLIPIIALTASASADIQQKARDYGMTDYVSKPFKPADLFETISKYTLGIKKAS